MNRAALDRIAGAVLYDGYLLYPYRGSAAKNQQRWTFGGLAPRARAHTGASTSAQTEVIVRGPAEARVEVIVRFLQLCERRVEGSAGRGAPVWHEAIDQEAAAPHASLGELAARPLRQGFGASGARWTSEGFVRRKQELVGQLDLFVWPVGEDAWRLRARVENLSPCADAASDTDLDDELALMVSMHLLLGVDGGAFESSLDPDVRLVSASAACKNHGVWPVLAGAPGERDTMIAAPLVLYDYPCAAAEIPGELFDGTGIDEIVDLRVLTMTEAEKAEARALDERARRLVDRTEALGEAELRRWHASMRARPHDALRPGVRVRLHPHGTRDLVERALAGKTGVIAGVEHDADGRVLCAVLVDADAGRDPGRAGEPGDHVYFRADEVELDMSRVLIAGVGNVLHGDDGFGPEVARALAGAGGAAEGVVVRDFGIRGYDLAFALLDRWDAVVLVDASARGGTPGTLYVIDPDELDSHTADPTQLVIATGAMHPARVLALVHVMGGCVERLCVLGCEPAPEHLGEHDDIVLGLSPSVAQAVAPAARLALELAGRLAEAAHA